MSSRDKILSSVVRNQPDAKPLPTLPNFEIVPADLMEKFTTTAVQIGSRVFEVTDIDEVDQLLRAEFKMAERMVSTIAESGYFIEAEQLQSASPHSFENIDLLLIAAQLGVAENSAVWVTQDNLAQRVLPFITQHLAVILYKKDIVANMHEAYRRIGNAVYDYAAFIAGPSKTADIEQSLVLGAHGPRSLTIFLI